MFVREKALAFTASGAEIDLLNPNPSDISIEDIAHHLAQQPRFAGATRIFYSVGQHSLMVARSCPENEKLWGLLHDASEAYLSDLISPIKHHLRDYIVTEGVLLRAICTRFGLGWPAPKIVKDRDKEIGELEKHALIQGQDDNETLAKGFMEQHWTVTKKEFLQYFERYKVESAEAVRLLEIAKWCSTANERGQIVMRHPEKNWIIRIPHPARTIPQETSQAVINALHAHYAEAQQF